IEGSCRSAAPDTGNRVLGCCLGQRSKAKRRGGARRRAPAARRLLIESLQHRYVLASSISGTVFNDLNQNGIFDPAAGETSIAGRTVYLDLNSNSRVDGTEPHQVTGSDGTYTFDNLVAGHYSVAEVDSGDYTQTAPVQPAP